MSAPTETQQSVLTSVQQEMAARRKANLSRQDSRLSVKCLIESIENATKQAKAGMSIKLLKLIFNLFIVIIRFIKDQEVVVVQHHH